MQFGERSHFTLHSLEPAGDLKLVIDLEVKRGSSCRFGENWEGLSRLQTPGKPSNLIKV